jgi:hypothetical protein
MWRVGIGTDGTGMARDGTPLIRETKRIQAVEEGELAMAKFMDVHSGFVGVTEDQLREAHERDLAVEGSEGVHFEHAWLDPESGKVFCLSSGPSKEAVMRVHEKAGHPTTEIYELPIDVE